MVKCCNACTRVGCTRDGFRVAIARRVSRNAGTVTAQVIDKETTRDAAGRVRWAGTGCERKAIHGRRKRPSRVARHPRITEMAADAAIQMERETREAQRGPGERRMSDDRHVVLTAGRLPRATAHTGPGSQACGLWVCSHCTPRDLAGCRCGCSSPTCSSWCPSRTASRPRRCPCMTWERKRLGGGGGVGQFGE